MTNLILEEIRHLLLQKVGIRIISPSDCALIALAISKKLRKNISETTIKRLFGFAAHNNQFSKFTVNTLLEFVEDEETTSVGSILPTVSNFNAEEDWDYLVNKARITSENTIRQIALSCTIPYEYTIDRKFANHDFDYFYESNFSFTVFVAQSGYGKSIMLSHLVQNQFLNPDGKYSKDVVLFLNASKVFKIDQDDQNLNFDIQKLLGLTTEQNLISFFEEQYQKRGKKLIIIFDSFYDLLQQNGHKPKIFGRILQLLCDIENSAAIKVVMSMRSYIWRRFFETIRHSHYLKNKWFPGSYFRLAEQSNMPLLTDSETTIVLDKLKSNTELELNEEIKALFKHPFYISYFYTLKEDYPFSEYSTNLILHEVMLRYLLNKIYQAKQAVEKIIICKKIIQLSNYGKNGNKIKKKALIEDHHFFKKAYMDLLIDGILIEEQKNENGFLVELVHFVQPHIFEYFLFKENLENHGYKMSATYFNSIFQDYKNDKHLLFALLKWSVFQLVKHNEFELIKHVLTLPLNFEEHNKLLLFLAESIKHQTKIEPYTKILLSSSTLHQEMLKKLIHLDFLDPSYQQVLNILTEITTDEETLATYHALLSLLYSLTFNVAQLKQSIVKLKELNYNKNWYINPLEFTEFLLMKLSGKPLANHPITLKLERYQKEFVSLKKNDTPLDNLTQKISGFYIIAITWIFGTPSQTINIINSIHRSCGILFKRSQSYSFYLLQILALEIVKFKPGKMATQFERILSHLQQYNPHQKSSQWSKDIYKLVLAYQNYNLKNYDIAIKAVEDCIARFKKSNYIALEVMCYQLLIKIYTALNDIDRANEYKYLILNQLESINVNTQLFDLPMQPVNRFR